MPWFVVVVVVVVDAVWVLCFSFLCLWLDPAPPLEIAPRRLDVVVVVVVVGVVVVVVVAVLDRRRRRRLDFAVGFVGHAVVLCGVAGIAPCGHDEWHSPWQTYRNPPLGKTVVVCCSQPPVQSNKHQPWWKTKPYFFFFSFFSLVLWLESFQPQCRRRHRCHCHG